MTCNRIRECVEDESGRHRQTRQRTGEAQDLREIEERKVVEAAGLDALGDLADSVGKLRRSAQLVQGPRILSEPARKRGAQRSRRSLFGS